MHPTPAARLHAGILSAHMGRCLHCGLSAGAGCSCGAPRDDRRRPHTEGAHALPDWTTLGISWGTTRAA